jgi:hypothetical protein
MPTSASPIDVVFSFDTTGSMRTAIAQVRRVVHEVTSRLFAQVPNLHVGIITHGDYCDGSRVITLQDLTDDQRLICDFIRTAPDTNGGDTPECYELVLNRARSLHWRSGHAKVLALIGDDVPHGPSYPQNTQHLDWRNELGLLKEAGVHVYGVQALARSHATSFYQELAKLSDGVHLDLHQFGAIVDLIMAICYKQVSSEAVEAYEQEVKNAGRLTDSTGAVFDVLLCRPVRPIHTSPPRSSYSPSPRPAPRSPSTAKGGSVRVDVAAVDTTVLKPVHPSRFQVLEVAEATDIKGFVVENGLMFKKGRGFYEFTTPVEVQSYKEVILVCDTSGAMYSGPAARALLGLPSDKTVKLKPGSLPGYTAFIQSTSVNRKLLAGTKFLYELDDYEHGAEGAV